MPFLSRKPKWEGEAEYKLFVEELHRWALVEFAWQFTEDEEAAVRLSKDANTIEKLDIETALLQAKAKGELPGFEWNDQTGRKAVHQIELVYLNMLQSVLEEKDTQGIEFELGQLPAGFQGKDRERLLAELNQLLALSRVGFLGQFDFTLQQKAEFLSDLSRLKILSMRVLITAMLHEPPGDGKVTHDVSFAQLLEKWKTGEVVFNEKLELYGPPGS